MHQFHQGGQGRGRDDAQVFGSPTHENGALECAPIARVRHDKKTRQVISRPNLEARKHHVPQPPALTNALNRRRLVEHHREMDSVR